MNVNSATSLLYLYEKDDPNFSNYGKSKTDNTFKAVLDSISYLTKHIPDSSKLTLTPEKTSEIFKLIKENKIDFMEIKSRVNTTEDLKLIRKIVMNPDKYEELFTKQE
ncbi:MAG: hypothetical protein ACL7BU_10180 [Candidatus Phlomobacter fragariae]